MGLRAWGALLNSFKIYPLLKYFQFQCYFMEKSICAIASLMCPRLYVCVSISMLSTVSGRHADHNLYTYFILQIISWIWKPELEANSLFFEYFDKLELHSVDRFSSGGICSSTTSQTLSLVYNFTNYSRVKERDFSRVFKKIKPTLPKRREWFSEGRAVIRYHCRKFRARFQVSMFFILLNFRFLVCLFLSYSGSVLHVILTYFGIF